MFKFNSLLLLLFFLSSRSAKLPFTGFFRINGWGRPPELQRCIQWRVRSMRKSCIFPMVAFNLLICSWFTDLFSHFSERGGCSHEWFRVKHNGTKDKLSGDGKFVQSENKSSLLKTM